MRVCLCMGVKIIYIGVLDPSDENHNFITQRETLKPVSMFRHPDGLILLCYNGKILFI